MFVFSFLLSKDNAVLMRLTKWQKWFWFLSFEF